MKNLNYNVYRYFIRSVFIGLSLFVSSLAAASDPALPNTLVPWESDLGEIHWIGGYYDKPENYLTGRIEFDTEKRIWAFKGRWGKVDRGSIFEIGDAYFEFEDKMTTSYANHDTGEQVDNSSFSGYYTYDVNPTGERQEWSGYIGTEYNRKGNRLKDNSYSYEGTPYLGPNAVISTFNFSLLYQAKLFKGQTRWFLRDYFHYDKLKEEEIGTPEAQAQSRFESDQKLRAKQLEQTAHRATSFRHTPNAAISGHNTRPNVKGSLDDCKRFCAEETDFVCKSFDYNKGAQTCDLSNKSGADVGGLKTTYENNPYDYYERLKEEEIGTPIEPEKDLVPNARDVYGLYYRDRALYQVRPDHWEDADLDGNTIELLKINEITETRIYLEYDAIKYKKGNQTRKRVLIDIPSKKIMHSLGNGPWLPFAKISKFDTVNK